MEAHVPIAVAPFAMVTEIFCTAMVILVNCTFSGIVATLRTTLSVVKRFKSTGNGLGDNARVSVLPPVSVRTKLLICTGKAKIVKLCCAESGAAIMVTVSVLVPPPLGVFDEPLQDTKEQVASKRSQPET